MARRRMVRLRWRWYDMWVGAFMDTDNGTLYVCPLPTVLVEIQVW